VRCFAKRKQQRRLTAAFSLTALTVLTRLTALTADRIDHIDIVDGQAPMRPSTNEVNLVNNVRCQYRQYRQCRQCRQYGQYRPNSLASAAGESDPEELIGSTMLFGDHELRRANETKFLKNQLLWLDRRKVID
jgi:hypothetical protein